MKFVHAWFPDARVKDYPLVHCPAKMTTLLVSYVVFAIYLGPRLMANRKPFHLNTVMVVYNFGMVAFNAFIVYEVRAMRYKIWLSCSEFIVAVSWPPQFMMSGWGTTFTWRCDLIDPSSSPQALRVR